MKNLKSINVILVIISICCFLSCKTKQVRDYTYKWKIEIVYTNGDMDTINCQLNTHKGIQGFLTISRSGACLLKGCGGYSEPVVCGVRKFEVLQLDTLPLD